MFSLNTLPETISYRPDIDGLRAVAVLLVILHHAGLFGFSGGYVGVDVFFVISGYLISQRIVYARRAQNFSFKDFYTRRIRRLFPAMASTCFFVLLAGCFLLPPAELTQLSAKTIGAIFSVANIQFYLESGYWDAAADAKPLLHLWSLSVEEQFYLFWPALLIILLRLKEAAVFGALAAIAIVSLATTTVVTAFDDAAAFYLTPFRIYEFALGAMCVWFDGTKWRDEQKWQIARNALFAVGMALIVASALMFDETMRFPGAWALVPTVGACFVLLARNPKTLGASLTNPPTRYVGRISYSLYLVHWPVLALTGHVGNSQSPNIAPILVIIVALSALQFHFIETPLRRPSGEQSQYRGGAFTRVAGAALGVALMLSLLASVVILNRGFPARYDETIRSIAVLTPKEVNDERASAYQALCRIGQAQTVCGQVDPVKVNILVVGDSHAMDGVNIARAMFPDANILASMKTGCMLVENADKIDYPHAEMCKKYQAARYDKIRKMADDIDVVFVSQFMRDKFIDGTVEALERIAALDLKIIMTGAGPFYDSFLVPLIAEHGQMQGLTEAIHKHALVEHYAVDPILKKEVERLGGVYIDKLSFFCPNGGPCRVIMPNGSPAHYDRHHLTLSAARSFGEHARRRHPDLPSQLRALKNTRLNAAATPAQ